MLEIGAALKPIQLDIFKFLRSNKEIFDIIFVDPPFTKKMADSVLAAVADSTCFHSDSVLFIESTQQESVKSDYGTMKEKNKKGYGRRQFTDTQFR